MSKSRYVMVEGVRVDIDALRGLAHQCTPSRCDVETSCCRTYEVFVDRKEQSRITGHLNDAARYASELREEGGFIEPFEETDGGSCLATDEDGQCVFAFQNDEGHVLCSLHAAALGHGLHPYRVKPFACSIWPLYYMESSPPLLTVQEGVNDFPCNSLHRRGRGLDVGVAEIIRDVWGPEFLAAVERSL